MGSANENDAGSLRRPGWDLTWQLRKWSRPALPIHGGNPGPAVRRRDARGVPGRNGADYPRPRPGRGDRRRGAMDRAQRLELGHARSARSCLPARRSAVMKSRPVPRALPSAMPADCGRCRRPGRGISTTIPSAMLLTLAPAQKARPAPVARSLAQRGPRRCAGSSWTLPFHDRCRDSAFMRSDRLRSPWRRSLANSSGQKQVAALTAIRMRCSNCDHGWGVRRQERRAAVGLG